MVQQWVRMLYRCGVCQLPRGTAALAAWIRFPSRLRAEEATADRAEDADSRNDEDSKENAPDQPLDRFVEGGRAQVLIEPVPTLLEVVREAMQDVVVGLRRRRRGRRGWHRKEGDGADADWVHRIRFNAACVDTRLDAEVALLAPRGPPRVFHLPVVYAAVGAVSDDEHAMVHLLPLANCCPDHAALVGLECGPLGVHGDRDRLLRHTGPQLVGVPWHHSLIGTQRGDPPSARGIRLRLIASARYPVARGVRIHLRRDNSVCFHVFKDAVLSTHVAP
mmetsp:Transcript_6683/g.14943  ORF Transcript_6683/g.14943 Transcript_6683/m.14943 type:complete len:277 (-) Transcript_6683:286-1116(-)